MVWKRLVSLGVVVAGTAWAASEGAAPVVPDVVRCTDRGLLAAVSDGPRLRGTLGLLPVEGSPETLTVRDERGREVWTGPLEALHPQDLPPVDRHAVAKAFAAAGRLKAKGADVKGKGVKASVDEDGVLRGTWKGDKVAWAFDLAGKGIFGGAVPPGAPLARLPRKLKRDDPFAAAGAEPAAAFARVVAAHARQVGVVPACGAGGTTQFQLGAWPHPIPLAEGRRVAWATASEALVRGADGAAWYLVVPMGAAQAAELAGEVSTSRGARVAWQDGLAAVLVTSDPGQTLPGSPVTPALSTAPLLPLLHPDPAADRPESAPARPLGIAGPGFDGGVEMVRRVNALRRDAGVAPVTIDEDLTWAALGHCAWIDANSGLDPAREKPKTPLYLGEDPSDRGGADELVRVDRGEAPTASVDAWASGPFSRVPILHPAARRAGACATPGGARVLEVAVARQGAAWEPRAWPTDGATGIPTRVQGTDAVLQAVAPGAPAVVGYPVTLWVGAPAVSVQVQRSSLLDAAGNRIAHFVVRGSDVAGGINAPEASIHLVPKAPLPAGETFAWELAYTVAGADQVRRGRFTTAADPGAVPVLLDPLSTRVVALLGAKRAERGISGDLVPTLAAAQAARLVAATRRGDTVDRLLPEGSAWYCAAPSWYEGWLKGGVDTFDTTLDPVGTDARYTWVGAAAPRGDLCLVFARATSPPPR